MPKFKFECKQDTLEGTRSNNLKFEAETWRDVLQEFEFFLRGCGYILPEGELTLVERKNQCNSCTDSNN